VVVISIVVLIVVGLVLAIVLVVKDRKTSPKPAGQSSVATTDTTPGAQTSSTPGSQTSSTPTPANTAAAGGALDPAKVAAAVDPWLVRLTIKRPSGATDTGNGIVLTADGQFVANDHLVDGAVSIMGTVKQSSKATDITGGLSSNVSQTLTAQPFFIEAQSCQKSG